MTSSSSGSTSDGGATAWLVRDGRVLASVEVADRTGSRLRGLLGRDGLDGALLLRPARGVHTFGMRFDIDVALCDAELRVLRVLRLRRHRITRPCRGARIVIETEAGVMSSWGLQPGDELGLRGLDDEPPDGPVGP